MESTQTTPPTKLSSALNFGAVLGLILAALSIVTYLFQLYENQMFGWFGNLIFIVGIVIGIKRRRESELGGYISYGEALGYGTLCALFAGIIVAFVSYIYLQFVDGSMIEYLLNNQEKAFYNSGQSSEDVESMMKNVKMMMNPGAISMIALFGYVFFGLVVSLIASAFLKKESSNFGDTI